MKIIDAHAHLSNHTYNEELNQRIKDVENNMEFVINIGWSLNMSKEVLELHKIHPKLLPVIGIHPNETRYTYKHDKNLIDRDLAEFENLINKDVIAIGEIGLDYFREGYDKELQKYVFIKQIEMAIKKKLPIIIHCREAEDDLIEIISNYPNTTFLLHSWMGNPERTKKLILNRNIYFSVNGILTYKNKQNNMIDSFPFYPKDRVLCETDSPWLTPEPFKRERNNPLRVEVVYKEVSHLWNDSLENTMKQINSNVLSFIKSHESK